MAVNATSAAEPFVKWPTSSPVAGLRCASGDVDIRLIATIKSDTEEEYPNAEVEEAVFDNGVHRAEIHLHRVVEDVHQKAGCADDSADDQCRQCGGGGCAFPQDPDQEGRGDRGSHVCLHALQILIDLVVEVADERNPKNAEADDCRGGDSSDENKPAFTRLGMQFLVDIHRDQRGA